MDLSKDIHGEAYERGVKIAQSKGCGLIPLCPANSHFTAKNIDELILCASENFSRIQLFIPDTPTVNTYEAAGYPTSRAKQKVSQQRRQLRKKAADALDNSKHELWEWGDIINQAAVESEVQRVGVLYSERGSLWESVRSETRQVIFNTVANMKQNGSQHVHPSLESIDSALEVPDERIEIGVAYILNELAFVTAAPSLLEVDQLAYVYHRKWMLDKYIEGSFDGLPKNNLGIAVIR